MPPPDWWTKYDASEDNSVDANNNDSKLERYDRELEKLQEYGGFHDLLQSFELKRGKEAEDGEDDGKRISGTFKGCFRLYKLPMADVEQPDSRKGTFKGLPSSDPITVLVRAYIVKCHDLHPMDSNGKADPYIVVSVGGQKKKDVENRVTSNLNPEFGRPFEFEITIPLETSMNVQIFDYDALGSHDLIGETCIDLESRYFSRHRGTCGLSLDYSIFGYNEWRDPLRPSQILANLCRDYKLKPPQYNTGSIRVAGKMYNGESELIDENGVISVTDEHVALIALHHWSDIVVAGSATSSECAQLLSETNGQCKLLSEHVETRTLYNPDKPGIAMGTCEMFIDMFDVSGTPPGPMHSVKKWLKQGGNRDCMVKDSTVFSHCAMTDISPRKPKNYELRIIIWNTDEVVCEDVSITGDKKSDIYVKSFLKDDDIQETDVHYNSVTGEGLFNWRFIFPFQYFVAEKKMVVQRKEGVFGPVTEAKVPARLTLQVWDADFFSADDKLGDICMDLNRMPKGAATAKTCTIDLASAKNRKNIVSIFKLRRFKGWWPVTRMNEETGEMELTGKVEVEMHLKTAEEAEENPVGKGREEPEPLDKPDRPSMFGFSFFPFSLKQIKYFLCTKFKWPIIKGIMLLLVLLLFGLFVYAAPGIIMEKVMGAMFG